MTPSLVTSTALEPRLLPGTTRSSRAPNLSPARPAAVIVPPTVLYVVTIAATTLMHAWLVGDPSVWTLLRAGTLAAIQLPALYAVRAIVEGRGRPQHVFLLVPPAAALLAITLDVLLPGELLHPLTLAVIFLVSYSAQPLARAWRDLWVRYRPARVTLLASSEWGASESVRRLEQIPGLSITSIVIPGCNAETTARLLGRPVHDRVDHEAGFEKRVIVSCPMRDPAVGHSIAQLVAMGHTISSKSRVLRGAEGRVDTVRADPLNLLLSRPSHWLYDAITRFANVVAAAIGLTILLPLFAVVAVFIKLESQGPVFYRQRRMGLGGRAFDLIKFRSMYQDAEQRSGPVWASEDDPRVTRVGRILRKYRIDELPQLINVLRGDMNLVGPRPERPHFFHALRQDVPMFELRTCVRPGITGWAQVRAPYAAAVEDSRTKLEYDLYYVLNRSIWLDFAIVLDTVGVAFGGHGSR
ncbi:MAG: exopolysaccharide biosynthesis polyprenyl glycosylphosphotransferase [Planctomycetota bacterium]|nr:exopolysaccharide biosynthesis polyprenyl glycosylphosphotransferase [Planctomycetota bacterium]